MGNENLRNAKIKKNDEFYTRYEDIEAEMNAYLAYNKDLFRNKTILCPCDNPEWSNFTKYFTDNFNKFGIKKLISTCIGIPGRYQIISKDGIENGNLDWTGDFRSDEVGKFKDEADYIITNPPFSLFIQFVEWVSNKQYAIIGNLAAFGYIAVFDLIKNGNMQVGYNKLQHFNTPDGEIKNVVSRWFTNFDIPNINKEITLTKEYDPEKYPQYINYDAINVDKIADIPKDYDGVMGVPSSIIDKYNPKQFELIGINGSKYGVGVNLTKEEWQSYKEEMGKEFYCYRLPYYSKDKKLEIQYKKIPIKKKQPPHASKHDLFYRNKDGELIRPYKRILIKKIQKDEIK